MMILMNFLIICQTLDPTVTNPTISEGIVLDDLNVHYKDYLGPSIIDPQGTATEIFVVTNITSERTLFHRVPGISYVIY